MPKTIGLTLAVLFGLGAAAIAGEASFDFDFSQSLPGRLVNRGTVTSRPGVARTPSPYGRLRESTVVPADAVLPGPALGRDGRWNALRFGDLPEGARRLGVKLEKDKPFTFVTWVYIYDRAPDLAGTFFNYGTGYKEGFRMEYTRAHWNRIGRLNLTWGTTENSASLGFSAFGAKAWHQIVLTHDGKQFALYVDGNLAEAKPAALNLTEDPRFANEPERAPGKLQIGGRWSTRNKVLDFKIDEFKLFDQVWTAEQVTAAYQTGKAEGAEEPSAELALRTDRFGYYAVKQPIEVAASVPGADRLRVNGEVHALPTKEPVRLAFDRPGAYAVKLEALAGDRVLRTAEFPVMVVSALPEDSRLGVANLTDLQPEAAALGIRWSRVRVDWAKLEPKKQEYDWTWLDAIVQRHRDAKVEMLLSVTGRPAWAGLKEGSQNLPADLESYRKLWRLLAGRYEIKHFEIGQEMNRNGQKGSPKEKAADYAEWVKVAAEAIRSENPEAKVVAGAVADFDANFAKALVESGAAFDILSIHSEGGDPSKRDPKRLAALRALTDKPIWNTVCGYRQPERLGVTARPGAGEFADYAAGRLKDGALTLWPWSCVPEETAADWLVKDLTSQFAGGVERCFLVFGPSLYYPEVNYSDGAPGAMGAALATFNWQATPPTK